MKSIRLPAVAGSRLYLMSLATVLLLGLLTACGSAPRAASSPTPSVAVSVSVERFPRPPIQTATMDPPGPTILPIQLRLVQVFVKDGLGRSRVNAMAQEIADMPEVQVYTFLSKSQALAEFKKQLGKDAALFATMKHNPLPASFKILVRDPSQAEIVAMHFFGDSRVDNDPGTTNGVQYISRDVLRMSSVSPSPSP